MKFKEPKNTQVSIINVNSLSVSLPSKIFLRSLKRDPPSFNENFIFSRYVNAYFFYAKQILSLLEQMVYGMRYLD